MTRRLIAIAIVLLAAALCIGPGLAQDQNAEAPKLERTKEQASSDALALQNLYNKHSGAFRGVEDEVSIHETSLEGTLKLCEEQLPKLQNLETNVIPEIAPVMARITALWCKPGVEDAARAEKDFDQAQFAFVQSGDIERNMKMTAADNDVAAYSQLPEQFAGLSTRYSDLARMLSNVHKTRVANAIYLADYVKNQPEITFFVQEKRVAIMTEWKTVLWWSLKFDPANEYSNTRLAKIDAEIASLQKAVEKEIDAKQWAGQMADFPGPGSVAELSRVAAEYFRKDPRWGNKGANPEMNADGKARQSVEVVAVIVRGPWQVAETDLFGRTISWRLPIHLAITKPDLKSKNIARVYELSMVTAHGAPNQVAKAPPFDGYWIGNSWMMRLSKVQPAP